LAPCRHPFPSYPKSTPSQKVNNTQAATYNVNGRKPAPGLDLQPWLASGHGADIVAVGFQEIVPLNAGNVMTGRRPASLSSNTSLTSTYVSPVKYGTATSYNKFEGRDGRGCRGCCVCCLVMSSSLRMLIVSPG